MRNYNQDAALLNKEERDAKKRAAVIKVFAALPKGIRVNRSMVVSLIMREWAIEANYYAAFSDAIADWISAESKDPNGILGWTKGFKGGVFIRADQPVNMTIQSMRGFKAPTYEQLVVEAEKAPAINNHCCPHCRNDKVSKDERSCWKCGGNL